MKQTVLAVPDAGGYFAFTNQFDQPLKGVAVWISSDGDDTHSSFGVTLDQLELRTALQPSRQIF